MIIRSKNLPATALPPGTNQKVNTVPVPIPVRNPGTNQKVNTVPVPVPVPNPLPGKNQKSKNLPPVPVLRGPRPRKNPPAPARKLKRTKKHRLLLTSLPAVPHPIPLLPRTRAKAIPLRPVLPTRAEVQIDPAAVINPTSPLTNHPPGLLPSLLTKKNPLNLTAVPLTSPRPRLRTNPAATALRPTNPTPGPPLPGLRPALPGLIVSRLLPGHPGAGAVRPRIRVPREVLLPGLRPALPGLIVSRLLPGHPGAGAVLPRIRVPREVLLPGRRVLPGPVLPRALLRKKVSDEHNVK